MRCAFLQPFVIAPRRTRCRTSICVERPSTAGQQVCTSSLSEDGANDSTRSAIPGLSALAAATSVLGVGAPAEAASVSFGQAVGGPLFEPLNEASSLAVRTLVWADFRVAVTLFVVAPLVLFFWSFFATETQTDAVKRILVGYWQASSLLMLTVFLNIADVPAAAFTGMFVQGLIPVTLLWWTDLIDEIKSDNSPLANAFRAWRWPAIVAAAGGVLVQLPFQSCSFSGQPLENPLCAPWFEPPHKFHDILIPGVPIEVLQTLAFVGCGIYFSYLTYLVAYVIPRCGRLGRKDRDAFSAVSALKFFGLIDKHSPGS